MIETKINEEKKRWRKKPELFVRLSKKKIFCVVCTLWWQKYVHHIYGEKPRYFPLTNKNQEVFKRRAKSAEKCKTNPIMVKTATSVED